ncbi:MAG TPA: hypothetical protein VFQ24_00490 [Terriglobia bacterium]|nr:hypothetical protein [Terriglobia bacterium]
MVSGRMAIRQGFRLVPRTRSAVWILFAANLLLAIVAGLPIYHGMLQFTSHSLVSRNLLTGFSVDWLTDFAFNNTGALEQYAQFIMVIGLIALPVNAILAGGVLARFQQPQRFRLGTFFRDCGFYAWRMLWLMVVALICYWAVFRFVNVGLGSAVDRATLYWMNDRSAFAAHLGVGLLVLLLFAFINMVIDFAQIRIVYGEGCGFIEAFLGALGFSIGRLPRAILVYAIPSLCGLALLGIYRLVTPWRMIHAALGGSTGPSYEVALVLGLLFVGQQLVMFGRYWFRVATWASEWSLFASTRGPASPTDKSGQRATA